MSECKYNSKVAGFLGVYVWVRQGETTKMYVRMFLFINDINEFFAEFDNSFENTLDNFLSFLGSSQCDAINIT